MKSYRYLLILFSLIIFSCTTEPENEGCTDDIACNYNSEAEKEDGSCTYADNFGDCCTNQETDECGICYGDNSVCTDCAGNINPCGFDESTLTFDSCPEYMNFDECEGDDCLCSCNGETIENTVFIWSEEETHGFCFNIEETTYLDMYGYAITGFPSQIFELGNLDTLILENNDFSEGIPTGIGQLTNLKYLSLAGNALPEIPTGIEQLINLTYLDLSDNQLPEIPSEIGNLTNLTHLYLNDNQLTGEIPSEIGQLVNLMVLTFRHNDGLTGAMPSEIGNLTNLTNFDLAGANLTGEMPPEIGNLTNLTYFDLYGNKLTGEIPPEIGNMTNLTYFDLYGNNLSGGIPSEIGNMSNLTKINLGGNNITGEIPPEIGQLVNLTELSIYGYEGDGLSGEIPSEIGNLTSLVKLDLSYNWSITGEIPIEIGNLTNLSNLYLQGNQFIGDIPSEIGYLINLENLSLSDNQLGCYELYISENHWENYCEITCEETAECNGTIPEEFCNIADNSPDFGGNLFCPPFPSCLSYLNYEDYSYCANVGCTDPLACNYNPGTDFDDNSCWYMEEGACDCDGNVLDCAGVCDGDNYIDECGICNSDTSDDCPVIDIDGNEYQYVKIGSKIWMSENLNVTHYNNGDTIATNFNASEWSSLMYAAYTTYPYDNDYQSGLTCGDDCSDVYGYLYNYYVVMEDDLRGICPEGWHVSTNQEWHELTEYLEEDNVGGKLKECTQGNCPDSDYWINPNVGATNETSFSALPSGFRDCCDSNDNSSHRYMGNNTHFWHTSGGYRRLNNDTGGYHGNYAQPKYGFSIRCVRD